MISTMYPLNFDAFCVHLVSAVPEVVMVIKKLNFHSKHAKVIMLIVMSWVLCMTTQSVMLKGMHDDDEASITDNSNVEKGNGV